VQFFAKTRCRSLEFDFLKIKEASEEAEEAAEEEEENR